MLIIVEPMTVQAIAQARSGLQQLLPFRAAMAAPMASITPRITTIIPSAFILIQS
jgi:hypothetical protein